MCVLMAGAARADRIVLGPDGLTLAPTETRIEYAGTPYGKQRNLGWLQYGLPQNLELQTHVEDIRRDHHLLASLDLQYPIFTEFGQLPALSVGVRDLLGTGSEHHSLYAAASRTLPLSDNQRKFAHDFRVTIGFGTERIDGLFIGAHSHLKAGLYLDAEYYRRRPNVSLALPLVRNTQARAYSLDGNIFYGLSYSLIR